MLNYIQKGDTVTLTAPYNVSSGGGLLVGSIFGIAANDAVNGSSVETQVVGIFSYAKASGNTFSQGAAVYWDNTAKNMTSTTSGNTKIGVAAVPAVSGDANVIVRLNGTF